MIDRLRKRFILVCTVSFLAVFTFMVAAIGITNMLRQERYLDSIADLLAANGGTFPDPRNADMSRKLPLPEGITPETRFTTRFYTVTLDADGTVQSSNTEFVADITDAEIEHSAAAALKKQKERGWYGDFRYKCFETNGVRQILFISGSSHRLAARDFMTSTVSIFGLASLAVLVLIVLLSRIAVRSASESYRKQKEFITNANHELKTPLTLILTNIDIAEAELGQNEWLDDIRTEGERMSILVNRLVTLSRMDEGKTVMPFAEFDLSAALAETVAEFEELAELCGRHLTSEIAPGIRYRGDEGEIRQLAAILLDNAVKYSDEGGSIRVTLLPGKHPLLTVTNDCREVDSIRLDRLFERFYREDAARTAGSGFGIGLSIAQSITQHHKGSIRAVKIAGGVIRFQVKL